MSSPSPVQIREANAHLAALHLRVLELEERLQAAENTVREQAESLIRKDDQMRAATQEINETKEREISFLNEKLCRCEETIKHYQQSLKERDSLVAQLQHRCHLLDSICKSRATLDSMLALMAEAERLGPLGGLEGAGLGAGLNAGGGMGEPSMTNSSLPGVESSCSPSRAAPTSDYCSPNRVICNHKDFSLSEDDVDSQDMDDMGFGTTV
ncbi:vimentin-type intermediate filament-associated coiled-coil protein [Myripristis murdjan]|uniref:Vimentin type intermediate filament associated coiled-coil protein n=1 Tax=Myripristis murdjan TaxID=586833 RepID=A0A667WDR5_9TELE|nr:vimentin-type intermediate filament-associated coiled-coil protein [Myripristis murdjan]